MKATILTPTRMAEWHQVLDRIDASISHALDETAEYERALAPVTVRVTAVETDSSADRHVRGLRMHLDAAEKLAEAVEGLLAADEGEARAWMSLAARARARLATGPATGIS